MLIAVAGPYSAGSEEQKEANLKAINTAAAEVYRLGHIPVVGVNASLFIADMLKDLNRREVINNISFAIVEKCDAILMTGSSPGADKEREIIEAKGKPVYYSISEIPTPGKSGRITFETERLILRSLGADLADKLLEFRKRNEGFFRPWSPEYPEDYLTLEYTLKNAEFIDKETNDGRTIKFLLFKKEEPKRIIGSISLSNIITGPFKSCFMGYRIDEKENNKGYATEAIKEVIRYGFEKLGLHRIEANIIPRNAASVRAAEKTGFVYEGLSRRYLKINGIWEDHLHYVIINEEEK